LFPALAELAVDEKLIQTDFGHGIG